MPDIQNTLNNKIEGETESRVNNFEESRRTDRLRSMERKVQTDIIRQTASKRKAISMGQSLDKGLRSPSLDYDGNQKIVFILGLTLCLVNDFIDLVLWQNVFLLNQVLDLTALFLLLLLLTFFSKSYPLTVFLIITVFVLEIVPVLGVLPFWTIGIIFWYAINKKS